MFAPRVNYILPSDPLHLLQILTLPPAQQPACILHLLLSTPPQKTTLQALAALSNPPPDPTTSRQLLMLGALDFLMPLILSFHFKECEDGEKASPKSILEREYDDDEEAPKSLLHEDVSEEVSSYSTVPVFASTSKRRF